MKVLNRKHSLVLRWFHWINFPLLALMIWSGAMIYWANPEYGIKIPEKAWEKAGMAFRLAEAMSYHFFFMWFFAINGIAYVIYTIVSGSWRELVPTRRSFIDAIYVTLHDLGLRKEKPPQGKFNAGQQIAYTAIILMGFGSLITGIAIYKPVQFGWLTRLCGGYFAARAEHFWLTIGYVVFFLVHVMQVIRAGWNNFRAMVIGVEVQEAPNE